MDEPTPVGEQTPVDDPTPGSEPAPPDKPRAARTVRDMVWSLAVVLAVVAALLLVTWRPQPDPVKVVDVTPVLTQARAAAGFPVLAPVGLGSDWRATSARWEPTEGSAPDPAWHLGLLAPDGSYVQVAQSATTSPRYVPEQTFEGRPAGEVRLAGTTWQRYQTADERALVAVSGGSDGPAEAPSGVTTVVSGTADWATLERVVLALRSA